MAVYFVATPDNSFVQPAGNPPVVTKTRDLPPGGDGYLAGEFPDGITTVGGAPVAATVRILYRPESGEPGDGVVVAEVQSAVDGTWRVGALNTMLRYDVVGRKDGFNDTIMANIAPTLE